MKDVAMAARVFTVLFILGVSYTNAQLQAVNGRIKISTVTTSGCGDTVNFITTQLYDAYQEYGQFLDLEFIPWGRTVRNPINNAMTCQFGASDCWANRLHRCVNSLLGSNQDLKMEYFNCEFSSPYPSYLQNSYACVSRTGLSLVDVDYCVSHEPGTDIDLAAEAAAAQPMQIINFVPAIVFNDQIDVTLHTLARSSLKSMICFALAADPSTGITSCTI